MIALAIPDELRATLYGHAQAAFPAECCGYLCGPAGGSHVDVAIACHNAQDTGQNPVAPERGAETGFVIAGRELFGFVGSFDGATPARVIYHSHPNGRAYFSTLDRRAAAGPEGPIYPVQHLVIGVTAAGVTEAAQFAWSAELADFVELARWQP